MTTYPADSRESLAHPTRLPVRAWIAERLFRSMAGPLAIRVVFPGGGWIGRGGPDSPVMRIVRPADLFRRIAAHGSIGFGEAYMAGDWTTTDLVAVLAVFTARLRRSVNPPARALRRWIGPHRPRGESNTVAGARSNIHRHYDLSNELFEAFLDESMTYSSAWFGPDDDLHAAQLRKIDGILDYACVRPGSTVLEIGTGWGSLAIRAAERGARVTTMTISQEQHLLARQRVRDAGAADSVRLLLQDYRSATGCYDAVVSVEMVEAVGAEYWPEYFQALHRLVRPGGRVALQAITMPHDRMLIMKDTYTWIQKYIFPGGQLLSLREIHRQATLAGLRVTAGRSLGGDYARTLREWRHRFTAQADRVSALGFDEAFRLTWDFYLAYSEGGFRVGYLDVWQLQLERHQRLTPYRPDMAVGERS
ncbi:class I SAM-dependent methyltransferase [Umezawaea endophytica]|uniref:Cyclopropane-fatty-acyl-phospholipid synthase family protein n=1 Tax=Umezawaea endophytica TaxID=1654476 RepID=A0A9X2VLD8_9PSEU|nr:cyclopropane-fatty-acyl-phospholipid synthase family protein [Umezawaea endophytica]MCS7478750.1 cyclopropane-fatty-acyl-phospholipid synthase family protein [Umezawaea endophytica]